jgi:hypothetical protein
VLDSGAVKGTTATKKIPLAAALVAGLVASVRADDFTKQHGRQPR